jgi:hypothetical protein
MWRVYLFLMVLLAGCTSSSVLMTVDEGARVYKGDKFIGVTPYEFWDRDISGTETQFTLKKEGYKERTVTVKKDVLYIHRLFAPPIFALPWLFGYEVSYYYELEKE